MSITTGKSTRAVPACAVLLVLLASACARASTVSPEVARSCHEGWGDAFDLRTTEGRRIHVEAPHPVRTRKGVALLGSPTFVWETPDSFVDSLGYNKSAAIPNPFIGILLSPGGGVTPIRRPPNVTGAIRDVIVTGPNNGSIDVFFATPPSATPYDTRYAARVWHATFDGDVWSTPELVMSAQNIEWYAGPLTGVLAHHGVLHAAASVFDTSHVPRSGVLYARRDKGGWHSRWLEGPDPHFGYLAFAPLGADTVGLFFTGEVRDADSSLYAVSVMWSHDNGATWGQPRAIRAIRRNDDGHWLQALSVEHEIHLLWATTSYMLARAGQNSAIVHLVTRTGTDWHETVPLTLANAAQGFAATVRHGRVDVVAQGGGQSGGLGLATLRDSSWTMTSLDEESVGRATLDLLPPDSIYVTWARAVFSTLAQRPFVAPKIRLRLGVVCSG
jgi:hypothetical protein